MNRGGRLIFVSFIPLAFITFPLVTGMREERLRAVRDQMTSMSPSTRVHFEMASFTETKLLAGLVEHIIPYADSLGMNEQVGNIPLWLERA